MAYDDFLKFLSDRFGVDTKELEETDNFGELGVDSLSLFNMITDIEDEFKISIDIDDMTEVDSVSKMYKYITEKVAG
ncbi:MAG: acyl carrier protein [Clostridiales bacterium]|nr:acyl carrier protein [Clostridiales bacterium]